MNTKQKVKEFRSKLTEEQLNKYKIQNRLQHRLVYLQKKITTNATQVDKRSLDDGLILFKRKSVLQYKQSNKPYRLKCVQRAIYTLTTLKYKNQKKRQHIGSKYLQILYVYIHCIYIYIFLEIKKKLLNLQIPQTKY